MISDEEIRRRQHARARIMGSLLGAFVVLLFFITLAKTGTNGDRGDCSGTIALH